MKPIPTAIRRRGEEGLIIEWNDGETRYYRAYDLLKACPCAVCAETYQQTQTGLTILSEADTTKVVLKGMQPVGRYAYHLEFNTGCGNGIYTLKYLKSLGKPLCT